MSSERFDHTVTTTCGYCGVGCRLEAQASEGRISHDRARARRARQRGPHLPEGPLRAPVHARRDRLTSPLIREGDHFRVASWDEALRRIVSELTRIKAQHGPDAIAGLASSRATNEDCYAMARLMRAAIGTNNIDNCSRVCHSPTSFALRRCFGLSGATGSFTDIDHADVAILIGVNPTQGHPVVGARIKQAALRGCKLITIDPRRIELADYGVLHLAPRPGTNAAVVLGLAHVVRRDGLTDPDFIAQRTEGYGAVEELIEPTPRGRGGDHGHPRRRPCRRRPHLRRGELRLAPVGAGRHRAQVRLRGRPAALRPGDDDRQRRQARIGAAAAARPEQRPGLVGHGRAARTPTPRIAGSIRGDRASCSRRRGACRCRARGYKIPQMFDAAIAGDLKAMYIFGEDVAQTDPDTAHVDRGAGEPRVRRLPGDLRERDDPVRRRRPARLGVLEKDGTFTNAERRFQLVEAAIDPPGGARTDFDILTTVSAHARSRDGLGDAVGRARRDRAADPAYAGVSKERIGRSGLQWPVHADGTDSPTLYDTTFDNPTGKGQFAVAALQGARRRAGRGVPAGACHRPGAPALQRRHDDPPDPQRRPRRPRLAGDPSHRRRPAVDIRRREGVDPQPRRPDRALRPVTERIEPGHVFTSFHFPEARTNLLVGQSADVNTSCPEYKVVAVDVRPMTEQPAFTPVLSAAD